MKEIRHGRSDKEWFRCLNEAIDFLSSTFAVDILTSEIIEEELDENGKEKVKKFKEVLGDKVLKYLIGIKTNMSISGALPKETILRDIKYRDSDFKRLRRMNKKEIEQEAEAYARDG